MTRLSEAVDRHRAESSKGPRCSIAKLLDSLPESDRDELAAYIGAESGSVVSDALEQLDALGIGFAPLTKGGE